MTATSATPPPSRFVLRDLTLPARLVLTTFMLSVGLGYVSAIINLHFQEASPGNPLPDRDDVITSYHGKTNHSQMHRLLTAHESLPFNGQGSMRGAFTRPRVGGVEQAINVKAAQAKEDADDPSVRARYEVKVLNDIDGERLALLAWINAGFPKAAYDDNAQTGFLLTGEMTDVLISSRMVNEVPKDGKTARYARVKSIIDSRCVRCHKSDADGAAGNYPLETYEQFAAYSRMPAPSGKSISKLALTTHVHLLGFSMLYGLTGLVLAFSRLPSLFRVILCPLALVAQVVDISCWWLARLDGPLGETFASIIPITGAVVAGGLVLQILISVFDMYSWTGRFVLVLLFIGAGAGGGFVLHRVVQPWLESEKTKTIEQPAEKKPEEKKPDEKKPDEKKPDDKKPDEKPLNNESPSKLEKLLTPDPRQTTLEFNGEGQMSKAFVNEGWKTAVKEYQKDHKDLSLEAADMALYAEREGERLALLEWIRAGGSKEAYEKDSFVLPASLGNHPLTPDFSEDNGKAAKIKSIIDNRCVRCHGPDGRQFEFPLVSYDNLKVYLPRKVAGNGLPNKPPVDQVKKPGGIRFWGLHIPAEGKDEPAPNPGGQQPPDAAPPPPKPRLPRRRYRRAD